MAYTVRGAQGAPVLADFPVRDRSVSFADLQAGQAFDHLFASQVPEARSALAAVLRWVRARVTAPGPNSD
jgi:hypothetical protein